MRRELWVVKMPRRGAATSQAPTTMWMMWKVVR